MRTLLTIFIVVVSFNINSRAQSLIYSSKDTILNEGDTYKLTIVDTSGMKYQWFRNGSSIADAVLNTYTVQWQGSYFASLSLEGQPIIYTDTINVLYQLLPLTGNNDTFLMPVTDFPDNTTSLFIPSYFLKDRLGFQIDDEVLSSKQLLQRLQYFAFNISDYPDAYSKIQIDSGSYPYPDILKTKGSLRQKDLLSYAYVVKQAAVSRTAFLLLPDRYSFFSYFYYSYPHIDPVATLKQEGHVYIYVKPNDGFRAIYNGDKSLEPTYLFNDVINRGGSYSATYFFEAMQMVKYLKGIYDHVIIVGQGQGGYIATLLAVESQPEACISVSGFSGLMEKPYHHSVTDFVIPGLSAYSNNTYLRNKMDSMSDTHFLFQFNAQDTHSFIQEDALQHQTETILGNGPNKSYSYIDIQPGTWNYGWHSTSLLEFISSVLD